VNGRARAKLWIVDGIFMFELVLWTLQLFLVVTGLDAYLGGQHGVLWPAALSSIVLALVNVKLVSFIRE
jgi:hypothetical protein